MRYRILSAGEVIGESDLEGSDPAARKAYGQFFPSPAYEKVRSVFAQLTEASSQNDSSALEACYRTIDSLGLTVEDEAGEGLAVAWVHIGDFSAALGVQAFQVEVEVEDADFFLA